MKASQNTEESKPSGILGLRRKAADPEEDLS